MLTAETVVTSMGLSGSCCAVPPLEAAAAAVHWVIVQPRFRMQIAESSTAAFAACIIASVQSFPLRGPCHPPSA
jgi:hypothetical protein